MTIQVSNESPSTLAKTLISASAPSKPAFLIVYSSLTNGSMWCPYCRQAEPFVNKTFSTNPDVARIVYVGQKEEWKGKADNPWRQEPFSVTGVPTLIKVTADGKWEQLDDDGIFDQKTLDDFVGEL